MLEKLFWAHFYGHTQFKWYKNRLKCSTVITTFSGPMTFKNI